MTASAANPAASPASPDFVPPYALSWFDRLSVWVEARPLPPWVTYLALGLLGILLQTGLQAGLGTIHRDTNFPFLAWFSGQIAYLLALMHYLDRSAKTALENFHPVLHVDPHPGGGHEAQASSYDEIRYRLTTMPPGNAWLARAGRCRGGNRPADAFHSESAGGRDVPGPEHDPVRTHSFERRLCRDDSPPGPDRGGRRHLRLSHDPPAAHDQPNLPGPRPHQPVPAATLVCLLGPGRNDCRRLAVVQLRMVRYGARPPFPVGQPGDGRLLCPRRHSHLRPASARDPSPTGR